MPSIAPCQLPALVNSIGLACDIVGVIILFRFGLPPFVDRTGVTRTQFWGVVDEGAHANDLSKAKRYDRISYVGLVFLVVGFAIQIAGNWI